MMKHKEGEKLGLFLMNQKGLEVLKVLLQESFSGSIAFVCIGRDKNVFDDYADAIQNLALENNVVTLERSDKLLPFTLGLAIGWRWLIQHVPRLLVIHDSLLPKYRGFAPLVNMLINGETAIGASLIWASDEYDKGNIIAQSEVKVSYPLKIQDAIEMILPRYAQLTRALTKLLENKDLKDGTVQNEADATYSLWRDETDYFIDWNLDAGRIIRTIDALSYPYPGARTRIGDEVLIVRDAKLVDDVIVENRDIGKVIFMRDRNPVIVCGKGLIMLIKCEKDGEPYVFANFRLRLR